MPQPTDIAHRRGRLAVDADAADWDDAAVRFEVRRPAAPGEPAARLALRLAWDRRALWALFEVEDPTLHLAPAAVAGAELFQWDSVELYLDGRGNREARMDADDFQVILAPDGRYALLQGDPLLAELEHYEVPKRERPSAALEAAGRRVPGGYVVECAIPFAALGITPVDGAPLALDVGLNDWLADHPPAPQLHIDLETLRKLDGRPRQVPPAYTSNGLEGESATDLEARLYRPWSLAGSGDFGHPGSWRAVRLSGRAGFADRVVDSLGPGWTLAGGTLSALSLVAVVLALGEWRHRRRIAALLERIASIEPAPSPAREPGPPPTGPAAPASPAPRLAPPRAEPAAPARPVALEWLEHVVAPGVAAGQPESLELRAMRAIHERLTAPLAPTELADALCVSLRTLERQLTEALGCTPSELILAVKMREARRLIARPELQVQEIARRVGYDDPAHFSRRFKAYFGLAPAACRQAAQRPAGVRLPAA